MERSVAFWRYSLIVSDVITVATIMVLMQCASIKAWIVLFKPNISVKAYMLFGRSSWLQNHPKVKEPPLV